MICAVLLVFAKIMKKMSIFNFIYLDCTMHNIHKIQKNVIKTSDRFSRLFAFLSLRHLWIFQWSARSCSVTRIPQQSYHVTIRSLRVTNAGVLLSKKITREPRESRRMCLYDVTICTALHICMCCDWILVCVIIISSFFFHF